MSSTTQEPPNTNVPAAPGATQTLVYLVRHAQTAWNLERRFQGQLDVPLSAEGVRQAQVVADWLSSQRVQISAVYASDLLRASQTARPIAQRLGLVVQPVSALREIHAGEWQGLLTTEIEELYPGELARWYREANEYRLPGGETIPEVQTRVLAWYQEAIRTHGGQTIVVVSHGLAIRSLLAALNGWNVADTEFMKRGGMSNTGVTAILADHAGGHSSVLFHNSLYHLDDPSHPPAAKERAHEPAAV